MLIKIFSGGIGVDLARVCLTYFWHSQIVFLNIGEQVLISRRQKLQKHIKKRAFYG